MPRLRPGDGARLPAKRPPGGLYHPPPLPVRVAFPRIPRGQDLHLTNDAYSPCACPAWHCPQCRHILVERQEG